MPNYVLEAEQFLKFLQNFDGAFKNTSSISEIVSHVNFPEAEHLLECGVCGFKGYQNVQAAYSYANDKYHLIFDCNCG